MEDNRTTVRTSMDVTLGAPAAFDVFLQELTAALAAKGIGFEPGMNGRMREAEVEVGQVVAWKPGEQILLRWRQADWEPEEVTEVELRFEPIGDGARVTLEHRGWGHLLGAPDELLGWFASEVTAPLLETMSPRSLGDWITDRRARKPSGKQSRAVYRDPLYHYPNFRVILAELALTADDNLIEIGCGGGAFLKQALRSGCRASAVDHSAEMVRLAREENHDAIASGRLDIRQASADELPFPDASFTCAVMTGVLGFLPDPVAVLREVRRVLCTGGRFVGLGSDPEWRGTPAAPEPMASRLHFYNTEELAQLANEAYLTDVHVVLRDLEPYAREVGIPEEHLALFAGPGAHFLRARKS